MATPFCVFTPAGRTLERVALCGHSPDLSNLQGAEDDNVTFPASLLSYDKVSFEKYGRR